MVAGNDKSRFAVSTGRRSADVAVLRVAASAMVSVGHVFHRSDNGVWLTAHVPPAYLHRD